MFKDQIPFADLGFQHPKFNPVSELVTLEENSVLKVD